MVLVGRFKVTYSAKPRRVWRRAAALAIAAAAGLAPTAWSPPASAAVGADLCAQVAQIAGFRGEALVTAVAVGLAESGCNPTAGNPSGALGLWQIHAPAHPSYSTACLYDPQCNANAAWAISSQGTNWNPWTVYTSGAYQSRLPAARSAVDRIVDPGALRAGQTLRSGESLRSPSGAFQAIMQSDGNFVLYRHPGAVLFATNTTAPGSYLSLQDDGNLVIFTAAGQPIWATMALFGSGGALILQDDGNLVLYAPGGPSWATTPGSLPNAGAGPPPGRVANDVLRPGEYLYTWSPHLTSADGRCRLVMQADGNLVLYGPSGALWSTTSVGAIRTYVALTSPGVVQLHASTGIRWASPTKADAAGGTRLVMQSDCNLVVYSAKDVPLWWTGTVR